ncbi:MAG: hypothetical protein C5B48_04350 [Candidatus Rokuibacteriota bacterium]|nr:MAG: hypothetical protein C5B48_04350 [Candidatus Rokubacteria bacterium]
MAKVAALVLLMLSTAAAGRGQPAGGPVPPNRVTVITDSVGGVLFWVTEARKELARGLDLDLETKTCRKLVDPGCPAYGDAAPPSALDVVRSLGPELGPTVVVDVGYNDQAELYGAHLDEVMDALVAAGVQHVVWVTLEEAQDSWARINAQIRTAHDRWPLLMVADWAVASAGKPWFSDGVHMTYEGGLEFANFLRPFVLDACGQPCAPPPPLAIASKRLPVARRGHRYEAGVSAQGGVRPYRWSVTGLPRGLHLRVDGEITGIPRTGGVSLLALNVRDAWDDQARVRLALRVR